MTITTEEAERLAVTLDATFSYKDPFTGFVTYSDPCGGRIINDKFSGNSAAAFRSLAAERDALRARVAELEGVLRPIACDCVDVEEDCYNDVEPGDDCVCFKARAALGETQ